jgi:hypothetical protein
VLTIQTPMGLSSFVVEKRCTTAPTSLLSVHGTAVSAAARVRTGAAAFGADLPGPPRGAPV